jgi:hypothetical protein
MPFDIDTVLPSREFRRGISIPGVPELDRLGAVLLIDLSCIEGVTRYWKNWFVDSASCFVFLRQRQITSEKRRTSTAAPPTAPPTIAPILLWDVEVAALELVASGAEEAEVEGKTDEDGGTEVPDGSEEEADTETLMDMDDEGTIGELVAAAPIPERARKREGWTGVRKGEGKVDN